MAVSQLSRRTFAAISGLATLDLLAGTLSSQLLCFRSLPKLKKSTINMPPDLTGADSIALDRSGRLYALCRAERAVCRLNEKGEVSGYIMNSAFAGESLLTIHEEADDIFFFVSDPVRRQIRKIDAQGRVAMSIGAFSEKKSTDRRFAFSRPNKIAISSRGEILVLDGLASACIHQFSVGGDYIRSFNFPNASLLSVSSIALGQVEGSEALWASEPFSNTVVCFPLNGGQPFRKPVRDTLIAFASTSSRFEAIGVTSRSLILLAQNRASLPETLVAGANFMDYHVCCQGLAVIYLLHKRDTAKIVRIEIEYV